MQDDYKSQVNMLKKQLKDASEQQGKGDNKLQSVTSNLRTLQEEKARLQSAYGQKEAQLNALVRNYSYCVVFFLNEPCPTILINPVS